MFSENSLENTSESALWVNFIHLIIMWERRLVKINYSIYKISFFLTLWYQGCLFKLAGSYIAVFYSTWAHKVLYTTCFIQLFTDRSPPTRQHVHSLWLKRQTLDNWLVASSTWTSDHRFFLVIRWVSSYFYSVVAELLGGNTGNSKEHKVSNWVWIDMDFFKLLVRITVNICFL